MPENKVVNFPKDPEGGNSNSTKSPLRVLIVDDEKPLRESLARLLRARGCIEFQAPSGEEALEIADKEELDLVILDLWMPKMNGLETLKKLRKIDPHVPVIAISAMGTDATIEACRVAGATGFIAKPFTAGEIDQAITAYRDTAQETRDRVASGAVPGTQGAILVADDHDNYRRAIVRQLRLDGFDVDEVPTGREAIEKSAQTQYDAYLLDIHMPDGKGTVAAAGIRSIDPYATILYMTGEASDTEIQEGMDYSSGGCLRKPVDREKLSGILGFLVQTGRSSRKRAEARRAFEELPAHKKASIVAKAKARKIKRSPETSRAIAVVLFCVIASVLTMALWTQLQRGYSRMKDAIGGVAGPIQMFDEIKGYLERDEQREIDRGEGQ